MKLRFHRYIIVALLALLSGVYQQQNTSPNQEIVLQFSDVEVTSSEAKNAVAVVTEQLKNLGVETIKVSEQGNGKLIISYYSDVDVVSIKNILSKEKSIALDLDTSNQDKETSQFPTEDSISYNLDVYEIQSHNDIEPSLNGSIVDLNVFSDQLLNPNVYSSTPSIDVLEKSHSDKVAFKLFKNSEIAKDNVSYVIPEVRAGPRI